MSRGPFRRRGTGGCRDVVTELAVARAMLARSEDRRDCVYFEIECLQRAAKGNKPFVCKQDCERFRPANTVTW